MQPTAFDSQCPWNASPDFVNSAGGIRSKHGDAIALTIIGGIAVVDLVWLKVNASVLYAFPLALMAATAGAHRAWRLVGITIFLTFAVYSLKIIIREVYGVEPVQESYRLINRTLVAMSIAGAGYLLLVWEQWLSGQSDPELSVVVQRQEQEVSATIATICLVLGVLIIAVIDWLVPANYNLAILYPIPLIICVWLQSRQLLWGLLFVMLTLSTIAYVFGPSADTDVTSVIISQNRLLSSVGLVALTMVLDRWIATNSIETGER